MGEEGRKWARRRKVSFRCRANRILLLGRRVVRRVVVDPISIPLPILEYNTVVVRPSFHFPRRSLIPFVVVFRQYGLPILAPIFLVALLSPYLPAKPSIRGANIAPGTVLVDAGDKWGNRLVSLFGQSEEGLECKTKFNQTTVRNKGGKTGFVSYPRFVHHSLFP